MSHLVLLRNDFGEEIRDVVSGGDVLDVEDSGSDLFFDPMVPQGDMFRPGLDHLVFGEGDRRLIVNKNCSWLLPEEIPVLREVDAAKQSPWQPN